MNVKRCCIVVFVLLGCLVQARAQIKYTLKQTRPIFLPSDTSILSILGVSLREKSNVISLYVALDSSVVTSLPKGTVAYVGEKKRTTHFIETFVGRSAVEIWKIRVSKRSQDQLSQEVLPKTHRRASFLYMLYHKPYHRDVMEEDEAYLAEKARRAQAAEGGNDMVAAAGSGDLNQVQALVREGVDVNSVSEVGWTPLTVAVQAGEIEVVRFLLQEGADLYLENGEGNQPIQLAKQHSQESILYLLYNYRDRSRKR